MTTNFDPKNDESHEDLLPIASLFCPPMRRREPPGRRRKTNLRYLPLGSKALFTQIPAWPSWKSYIRCFQNSALAPKEATLTPNNFSLVDKSPDGFWGLWNIWKVCSGCRAITSITIVVTWSFMFSSGSIVSSTRNLSYWSGEIVSSDSLQNEAECGVRLAVKISDTPKHQTRIFQ